MERIAYLLGENIVYCINPVRGTGNLINVRIYDLSMAKRIEVLGAALVSPDGIFITGDLGIEKDIDIVAAMFSVVSNFIEDTFAKPADQIRLGDLFVSRITGSSTVLWLTSTGMSEEFVRNAKEMVRDIEIKHPELTGWDGTISDELKEEFFNKLDEFKKQAGEEEDIKVASPGFDLLGGSGVKDHINALEEAYNGYFLLGDHDTAFDLANRTALALESEDPDTEISSLFYALAARVIIERRDKAESLEWLGRAREKSEKQNNVLAQAETANCWALFNVFQKNTQEAINWSQKGKELIKGLGDISKDARNYLRLIKFELTEVRSHATAGNLEWAIKKWKSILDMIEHWPEGASAVGELTLSRDEMKINNNIGYAIILDDMLDPEKYKEAIPFYRKALDLVEESNAKWYKPAGKTNLAQALVFTGGFEEAKKLLDEAIKEAEELQSEYRIALVEGGYGVYYYRLGSVNKSVDDLYEAMHWFKQALKRQKDSFQLEEVYFFKTQTEQALKEMI